MVLGARQGGAPQRAPLRSETGSQSIELLLVLPVVTLLLVLVACAGLLGADLVAAQAVAREAARSAAVGDVDAAHSVATAAADRRTIELELVPGRPSAGEVVTASVRLRSRAFEALGADVWLPGQATMRVEGR